MRLRGAKFCSVPITGWSRCFTPPPAKGGLVIGKSGADAFTIMKLMGCSSGTVSKKYAHFLPRDAERAVERTGTTQRVRTQNRSGTDNFRHNGIRQERQKYAKSLIINWARVAKPADAKDLKSFFP